MHLQNELSSAKAQVSRTQLVLDGLQAEIVALRAASGSHADEVKSVGHALRLHLQWLQHTVTCRRQCL